MKLTRKKLKEIIKEEIQSLRNKKKSPVIKESQATQLVNDLKDIFRQFDEDVLTKPGNLELIKSKVDALVGMSGAAPGPAGVGDDGYPSDAPVDLERAELGDAADAFLGSRG